MLIRPRRTCSVGSGNEGSRTVSVSVPTPAPPRVTRTRKRASMRPDGPRVRLPDPVNSALPSATSALPCVTSPSTFISGSNEGKAAVPAIRHVKCPRAEPSPANWTPKPNCENGSEPVTVPTPPPLATAGVEAAAGDDPSAAGSPPTTSRKPSLAGGPDATQDTLGLTPRLPMDSGDCVGRAGGGGPP